MNKYLLAIVGLPGAGKTEATEYVMQKAKWPKVYFADALFEEMKERGIPVNEANERAMREDYRKRLGMGAFSILNLPKIKELYKTSSVILESLYSWEEYLEIKKEFGDNFKVMAVFASPSVRQERMAKRPKRPLTAEEFVSRDYSQIENLHQAGPIARADFMVVNEASLEDLHKNIDEVIKQLS